MDEGRTWYGNFHRIGIITDLWNGILGGYYAVSYTHLGLFGGTVFPLAMGVASDAMGQSGAVAVMTVGVLYLLFYTFRIKK